jgi:PAS domain S-box-containing protein
MTSPDLLARIVELADDAIISIGADQRIRLFNQGAERIFGYSAAEAQGQPLALLLPLGAAAAHRRHVQEFGASETTSRRMGERQEISGRRKDGTEFPAEASISKVTIEGGDVYTVILRDVTERRNAEKKIAESLREKEALLREIHHRVRNNLQVIYSLLGLQSRATADARLRKAFQESQDRIQAMALLHQSLHESGHLSKISFSQYVEQLCGHLFRSWGAARERVRLVMSVSGIPLSLDVAVPCGLIINELVSNSLNYAFPDGREGEIRIELHDAGDSLVRLIVEDNGVGFPPAQDPKSATSLGLRLVRSLAEQLSATFELNSHRGVEARLTFARET